MAEPLATGSVIEPGLLLDSEPGPPPLVVPRRRPAVTVTVAADRQVDPDELARRIYAALITRV